MTTLLLGAAAAAVTAGVLVGVGWLKVRLFGYTFEPTGSSLPYLLYEGFIVSTFAAFALAILFALGMAVRSFGGQS